MPDDFLAGYEFGDFEGAAVNVLVAVLKFSAELVGVASISSDHQPRTLLMARRLLPVFGLP
jgi:hypothetical protein